MAQTSSEQMRAWNGPALLSFGFRPFFLFSAVWAVFSMLLWIATLSGALDLPTRFDPVSWHAHAFLFGYLNAVLAGFLLTAVPNWTGRLPLVGWPLLGLVALWIAGRVSLLFSAHLTPWAAALVDLTFTILLGYVVLREIVAGKNWRNLIVLGLLAAFTIANALFHIEAATGEFAAQGAGLRLGLATAVMMIAVIGGRIIPSFTRNWMVQHNCQPLPVPPMQRFDKFLLLLTIAGLLIWVIAPELTLSALLLCTLGALHLVRLLRWKGYHAATEPLVWVLHISYAFIPAGALVLGMAILKGDGIAAAQHLWMVGGIGGMTLAVMTRATLGHTGQPLHANLLTVIVYCSLFGAVIARFGADSFPVLTEVSGLLWLLSFGGFLWGYGPLLLRPRQAKV